MTIKQQQWQLWYLGYYSGSIDGIYGPQSFAAARSFQAANQLDVDGSFGTRSQRKSMEIIRSLQSALGVSADGLAGPQTKAATLAFQRQNGLQVDGIAGPETRAALEQTGDWWERIEYFHKSEFKCKCGGRYCDGYPAQMHRSVVQVADRVRKHFGAMAMVSSGLRCRQHNRNVGGVADSRHLTGHAMDFCVQGRTARQVLSFVRSQPEITYAYAIDANYVHMQVK